VVVGGIFRQTHKLAAALGIIGHCPCSSLGGTVQGGWVNNSSGKLNGGKGRRES